MRCPFDHDPINIACRFCLWHHGRRKESRKATPEQAAAERKRHNDKVLRLYNLKKD